MEPDTLREWRKARGMTLKDFATLAGVTERAVIYWEKGQRPIPKLVETYVQEHPAITPIDARKFSWVERKGEIIKANID